MSPKQSPPRHLSPGEQLLDDFLSGDGRRVLHAVWEVFSSRDPELLGPSAAAVPTIDQSTEDLELGGIFLSNGRNLDHALDRLRLFYERRCLCAAYTGHLMYEPRKEVARGHVRIVAERPSYWGTQPGRPIRLCVCTACGHQFEVEEGESHYEWWKWRAVLPPVAEVGNDPADRSLLDTALAALTFPWTGADEQAARRAPYPLPVGLLPLVSDLVAALPAQRPTDAALTVDHRRQRGHPRRLYSGGGTDWSRVGHVGRLPRVVLYLLADGVLGIEDGRRLVAACGDPAEAAALTEQLLLIHLQQGDLAAAAAAADALGTDAHRGWRDLGYHHADACQVEEFLALWPRYDVRRDRDELDDLVRTLVGNVARLRGWRSAVALCTTAPQIGPGHRVDAFARLRPWPPAHTVEELLNLFAGEAAGVLTEVEELTCLVAAVRDETSEPPGADHPAVPLLLDRIVALGPQRSKPVVRTRDRLLADLRPAVGDEATLARLLRAVHAARLRVDLRAGTDPD